MRKVLILLCSFFCISAFGGDLVISSLTNDSDSGSILKDVKEVKSDVAEKGKNIIDQSKSQLENDKQNLVGSSSSTWTPAYLKVKKFKKCLKTENYKGWQGYCLPAKKPKKCPGKSWQELNRMNLVPCMDKNK
ncbi:MAG: hypothetical protein Kow0076_5490 [Francisella sp.]